MDPSVRPLEEIIVRARKRDEALQNVGIAVSVISGDSLEQMRIKDPRELVSQIPSLQIQTSFGMTNPAVFLRGVGVNDVSAIASGATGFYLDGVYLGSPSAQLFQFFDLERVEVLRGPQGTLYGRNTPAGAVNFFSRNPDSEFDARLRLSYGRFDERVVDGAVGGGLSDTVSGRLAFLINQRDGYVNNQTQGSMDSDVDNWATRASLKFQPNERFEGIFKLHSGRSNAGSKRNKSQGLLDPASLPAPVPCATPAELGNCSNPFGYIDGPDPYTGSWNRRGDEDVDYWSGSASLYWTLPLFTLSSITAYTDTGRFIAHDADASPNQLLEIDWQDDSREWSQELRLNGTAGNALEWIAGLYFFDRRVEMTQVNDAFRDLRPVLGFNPMMGVLTVKTDLDADISAAALFGQIYYPLTEKTRFIGGLRFTSEEHRIDRFDRVEEPGLVIGLVDITDRVSFDDVSGKLGVEVTTQAGNLFHASLSRGFKSGGFNGSVALDPDSIPPFDEETVISLEGGFKWTSANQRLRINTTAFHYDYQDLQVFTRVNTGGIPREVLANAANADISGLEVELTATVANWDFQFAAAHLNTELEDFQTFDGADFSGNDLVYAPDSTLSGLIRKSWPLSRGQLLLQTDFHYQDQVFFDTSNNPIAMQDAYWLWNARFAYRSDDGRWELALWGENLSDEVYKIAVIQLSDFGFNNLTFGEPRTWGVEFAWQL